MTDVLVPSFSPDDVALKADPYIAFARLREHDPIHRSDLARLIHQKCPEGLAGVA